MRAKSDLIAVFIALVSPACGDGGVDVGSSSSAKAETGNTLAPIIGAMYHHWYTTERWQAGHPYTPVLGLYDSADPEVIRQHIDWAHLAGINTFVIDSWILPRDAAWMTRNTPPVASALDAAGMSYFFIADGWFELEGNGPDGLDPAAIADRVVSALSPYFARPGYLRVDGRPVIFFWASDNTSCALWDAVRGHLEGALGPVYLTGFSNSDISCWDRVMYYNPYNGAHSTYQEQVAWQEHLWTNWESRGRPWAPTATPGYDDTLVRLGNPPIPIDPEYFRQSLQLAMRFDQHAPQNWLFVCSFNEWHEGSMIEPTTSFSDPELFLKTMRHELEGTKWIVSDDESAGRCDPVTRPYPDYLTVHGVCRPACGRLGGTVCESAATCPSGTESAGGPSYDCRSCCREVTTPPGPVCDPASQPAPHWGERDGKCLKSCGGLGGTACAPAEGCPAGTTPVPGGLSYDCTICCA